MGVEVGGSVIGRGEGERGGIDKEERRQIETAGADAFKQQQQQ